MSKNRLAKRSLRLYVACGLITIGIAAALAAVLLAVHGHRVLPQIPPGAMQAAAKDSVKPSAQAVANYTVPPTHPKYIDIPAINVPLTRVLPLGVTSNNEIATPDTIYDSGWYTRSALPGQPGAMFIYGHVSSWTASGVFYNLKKLRPGDKITVTRGDNKKFTYQVVSSKVYNYQMVDMNQVLAPVNAGKPGLNLMTCTGQVIKGTSEFDERLVVFTSLVDS